METIIPRRVTRYVVSLPARNQSVIIGRVRTGPKPVKWGHDGFPDEISRRDAAESLHMIRRARRECGACVNRQVLLTAPDLKAMLPAYNEAVAKLATLREQDEYRRRFHEECE